MWGPTSSERAWTHAQEEEREEEEGSAFCGMEKRDSRYRLKVRSTRHLAGRGGVAVRVRGASGPRVREDAQTGYRHRPPETV